MKKEIEQKLLQALKSKFLKMLENKKAELIEHNEDEYFIKYDTDSVDVGVGSVTVRREAIYDEDRAFEDAKEIIIDELINNEEAVYDLFEDVDFTEALEKFLKGC